MSFINANFAIYLALTQLANFFSITEDESMVMYNAEEFAIEIAKFKNLIDAVEYVKWLCD